MFSKRLADPAIFAFFSAEDDDEVVACYIVRMEEVCNKFEQTKPPREYDELIFILQFLEKRLLECLEFVSGLETFGVG